MAVNRSGGFIFLAKALRVIFFFAALRETKGLLSV
jgi:hypothetical protein